MQKRNRSFFLRWPDLAIMAGGLLMVVLWPVYIRLHGPTSYSLDGHLLGRGPEFWGSMMEAPASLLIALGLSGHYALIAGRAGRAARLAFVLIMIGLVATSLADLILLAIVPPLLSPLVAMGLILLAVSHRDKPSLPRSARLAHLAMGGLLLLSLLWTLLLPQAAFDRLNGYIVFGVMANLLFGVGWIIFGLGMRRRPPPALDRSAAWAGRRPSLESLARH